MSRKKITIILDKQTQTMSRVYILIAQQDFCYCIFLWLSHGIGYQNPFLICWKKAQKGIKNGIHVLISSKYKHEMVYFWSSFLEIQVKFFRSYFQNSRLGCYFLSPYSGHLTSYFVILLILLISKDQKSNKDKKKAIVYICIYYRNPKCKLWDCVYRMDVKLATQFLWTLKLSSYKFSWSTIQA